MPDADAAAVLAAASERVVQRRLVEISELELLAQWAAIHSADLPPGSRNRLVQIGGEGTPQVQDHCLGEIALARGTHVTATTNALADVLDLIHRLPRIWAVAVLGGVDVWIVRKVARMSREVPLASISIVDAAIARMLGHEGGGRILDVAEAKIIEADLDAHNARIEQERRRRYVGLGRTNEHGLRHLIAQIDAGDAAWLDATITQTADLLSANDPVDRSRDEWRAIALGYLARPAELLALLAQEAASAQQAPEAGDSAQRGSDGAAASCSCGPNRAIAFPCELLDALQKVDWRKLRPKATLYLHLAEGALTGFGSESKVPGVVRVESAGAFGLRAQTLDQLHGLLAHARVTVKPVIDLNDRIRTTAYEHPESLKERVYLRSGGDYWPYSTSTSRNVDYDHVTPYDDTGPPGQTGTHNAGPLGRRHHRWKTHAGYRVRQIGEHRYLWTTPHGLGFVVDHRGTHRITTAEAKLIASSADGLEIYPDLYAA
ncbi:hypothetical protein NODU109028_19445 [Nocardioides dubius]|uniref:DUF222 domain-containing protein n=1 Tax=Nocardioides dubius TaxID=317019 RepID=A0ABN1TNG3_9ACTN